MVRPMRVSCSERSCTVSRHLETEFPSPTLFVTPLLGPSTQVCSRHCTLDRECSSYDLGTCWEGKAAVASVSLAFPLSVSANWVIVYAILNLKSLVLSGSIIPQRNE